MEELKGLVQAICISEKRGIEKTEVPEVTVRQNYGIEGDAHAGSWHRQVSLLSYEKVKEFNERGASVDNGAFGENLVVAGLDFRSLPVGSILEVGTAKLRMTQIGKECHSHCAIFQRMGECIMPHEGVFAEVLEDGIIRKNDVMHVILPADDRPFTAAVITLSDKGAKGEREDLSGPLAKDILEKNGYEVVETMILPDEQESLKTQLIRMVEGRQVDLVITNGGTGFSLRDQTPEATKAIADREAPGIAEYIRMKSMEKTDRAMLSRGVAIIRKKTLIINLPGSPKAVEESLSFVMNALDHGLKILRGSAVECARK